MRINDLEYEEMEATMDEMAAIIARLTKANAELREALADLLDAVDRMDMNTAAIRHFEQPQKMARKALANSSEGE